MSIFQAAVFTAGDSGRGRLFQESGVRDKCATIIAVIRRIERLIRGSEANVGSRKTSLINR